MPPRQQRAVIRKKKRLTTPWDEVSFRSKMYCILDRVGIPDVEMPRGALVARTAVFAFMIFVTVLLTLTIIVGSLPQYALLEGPSFFYVIEMLCVLIFSIDWTARLVATPKPLDYLINFLNIVDLLGLLPYWLELGGVIAEGISKWFLVLRVTRLVRALLFLKNFGLVVSTVEESTEVGMLLVMIVGICLPIFGTSFFYAERGTFDSASGKWRRPCAVHELCDTEVSPFQTAFDGMWFTMTTITTLGLGDLTPKSDPGKIIAAICMCVGIFLLSFPVMILAVNFEHERRRASEEGTRRAAKEGRRLQQLQTEHTSRVAKEGDTGVVMRTNRKRGFFVLPSDRSTRHMRMTNPGVCRYDPLLMLRRNDDGTIHLMQPGRNPYEFRFTLILGSSEADNEARNTMNLILPEDAPSIAKASHFHTPEVHFALEKPHGRCEFLDHIRLLKASVDGIEERTREVHGVIELLGFKAVMDEQKLFDVAHALKRCRLRVTATVAHEEPTVYDVPFFFDTLRATNLVKELTSLQRGVVFLTEAMTQHLLNGVHHLIRLPQPSTDVGGELIINAREINEAVTKAVLRQCATVCGDPDEYHPDDFLYGDPLPGVTYYGIFVHRLLGGKVDVDNDGIPDDDEWDAQDKDQRVLVNLNVLAINPHYETVSLAL